MIDCHIHSDFSSDSREKPEAIIQNAVKKGLKHIVITDHADNLYKLSKNEALALLKKHIQNLGGLKEKYKDSIYVGIGLEVGWTKDTEQINAEFILPGLEYVINSIHETGGSDCYFERHFEGREKYEVYNEYFDAVLKSLDAPYPFHALGHLSYIIRNAPYKDRSVHYNDFSGILNELLKKTIGREAIIELNTSVCTAPSPTLPELEILKHYRRLGGKYITFSSDAHSLFQIGHNYKAASNIAEAAGFDYWTVIQNGQKKQVKI